MSDSFIMRKSQKCVGGTRLPIEQAETIAHSQVVWAILFIILFGFVIDYIVRTSDKLDNKLIDFYGQTHLNNQLRD